MFHWTILTARHVSNKLYGEIDMLSWDDFNSEEAQAAPAIKQSIPEPAKAQAQPMFKKPQLPQCTGAPATNAPIEHWLASS
jgi:hypothetical protein